MKRRVFLFGGLATSLLPSPALGQSCIVEKRGRFIGSRDLRKLDDDLCKLSSPFAFVDGCGKRWSVPKGAVTDGASIPRVAQRFIGEPYRGLYLDAAIVHDWFCATRIEPYDDVHRMFYNGMVTSQVHPVKARIMYAAVCWKGPKWDKLTIANNRLLFAKNPLVFNAEPAPKIVSEPRPMEMPPQPVAKPDDRMQEIAKEARVVQDVATAEAYEAKYRDQRIAYEKYEAERDAYDEGIKNKIAENNRRFEEIAKKRRREQELFDDLIKRAESAQSLDQVASMAYNLEGVTKVDRAPRAR